MTTDDTPPPDNSRPANAQPPESYPILRRLEKGQIFSVFCRRDGAFDVCEECDHYYSVILTREELIALADELRALAAARV